MSAVNPPENQAAWERRFGALAATDSDEAPLVDCLRHGAAQHGWDVAAAALLVHFRALRRGQAAMLIAALDADRPMRVDQLVSAALEIANVQPENLRLARLALRAVVRWGDPATARFAIRSLSTFVGPRETTPTPGEAAWLKVVKDLPLQPDQHIALQAVLDARTGSAQEALTGVKLLRAWPVPIQAPGLVSDLIALAHSMRDQALLDELKGLAPKANVDFDWVVYTTSSRDLEAEEAANKILPHLRRYSIDKTAAAIDAGLTLVQSKPALRPIKVALISALCRWGDVAAAEAAWGSYLGAGNGPRESIASHQLSVLRALGREAPRFTEGEASMLSSILDLRAGRGVRMDADLIWLAKAHITEQLAAFAGTLLALLERHDDPRTRRLQSIVDGWPEARRVLAARSCLQEGAVSSLRHLVDGLVDEEFRAVGHAIALGDLLMDFGEYERAFEIYKQARTGGQDGGPQLSARLMNNLDADASLSAHAGPGCGEAILPSLAVFLKPEMSRQVFSAERLLLARDIGDDELETYVEPVAAGPVDVPRALYVGDEIELPPEVINHPPVYGAVVRNADVVGNSSAVILRSGVLYEPMHGPKSAKNNHRDAAVVFGQLDCVIVRLSAISRSVDAAVSLLCAGSSNYYHWMFDVCSRLIGLYALPAPPEGAVILVEEAVLKVPQLVDILARANRWSLPVLAVAAEERIRVERLWTASPASWSPLYRRKRAPEFEAADCIILAEAVAVLRGLVAEQLSMEPPSRRILLSRVGQRNTRIVDEAEVAMMLVERFGFEVVDPSTMTFGEQVACFSRAAFIVGASGGAMTNVAFCSEGARVICMIAGRFDYSAWRMIGQACGADVRLLAGKTIGTGRLKYHLPYRINLEELAAAIDLG